MKFYMAPMEGLTGYIYRMAYQKYFHDVDRYFTPFLTNKKMNDKEINDILPEHNEGMDVVPQILTNRADDFISIAKQLKQYGYHVVNLNLGCPSGTVTAKNRGAGFLALQKELDLFLEKIFSECDCRISIKTRIGQDSGSEWEQILSIYEKYPLEELIIHPRIQKDFYKHPTRTEAYRYAEQTSRHTLCYNGDIHTLKDYKTFLQDFPKTERIMLGRGILQNPGLVGELKGNRTLTKDLLRRFHDDILEGYEKIMSGDRNTLFRMKELWFYMGGCFTNPEKYVKKIKKTERLAEYSVIVDALFREQELL